MRRITSLLLWFLAVLSSAQYTVKLTLAEPVTTSCAVFNASGVMVRKLWDCQPYTAGVHQINWDGTTDFGVPATGGPFSAKLLTSNAQVTWEGTLGNTSSYCTGATSLGGLGGIVDILSVGSNVYFQRGYSEFAGGWISKSALSALNQFAWSGNASINPFSATAAYVGKSFTTDGTNIYEGAGPNASSGTCFVAGYAVSGEAALTFSGISPTAGNNQGQWIVTGTNLDTYATSDYTNQTTIGVNSTTGFSAGQYVTTPSGVVIVGSVNSGASTITFTSGVTISNGAHITTDWTPFSVGVQHSSAALASAIPNQHAVTFWDKLVGTSFRPTLADVSWDGAPTCVRWSADDSTLWVGCTMHVYGYTYAGSWSKVKTISGPAGADFVGMATDPLTGNLAIAWGAPTQQVKVYDATGTTLQYTVGTLGGYATSPTITDTKFFLYGTTGLGFQADGQLWVLDIGGDRVLRFNPSVSLTSANARVCFVQPYNMTADPATPTRIIVNGYIELARNYSYPATAGYGLAWTPVNNWGYGYVNAANPLQQCSAGLANVVTGSNGHVYAKLTDPNLLANAYLVELTGSGIRQIGLYQTIFSAYHFNDLWLTQNMTANGLAISGSTATISSATLTGFDGSFNPLWGSFSVFGSAPYVAGVNPMYGGGSVTLGGVALPFLSDGSIPTVNTDAGSSGNVNTSYYGNLQSGASGYTYQTCLGNGAVPYIQNCRTPWTGGIVYPVSGIMGIGAYAAIFANGEFWAASEANQVLIMHESGLGIAQVGQCNYIYGPNWVPASGKSGNFVGQAMVQPGDGTIRIFHSDESGHQAVHEWKISNLSTVQVASVSFTSNLASFVVTALGSVPVSSSLDNTSFIDTFNRTSSGTVGNGWTDVSSKFAIVAGPSGQCLQATAGGNTSPSVWRLQRGLSVLNTQQKLLIPVTLWNQSFLSGGPTTVQGSWGLISRVQSGGAALAVYAQSFGSRSSGIPTDIPYIQLTISILDASGNYSTIAASPQANTADNPGDAYSITFTTYTDPANPVFTYARAVLWDETTQSVVATLNTRTDDPSVQGAGDVGILGGYGNCVFGGYWLGPSAFKPNISSGAGVIPGQ
jgi:hypothetical protein